MGFGPDIRNHNLTATLVRMLECSIQSSRSKGLGKWHWPKCLAAPLALTTSKLMGMLTDCKSKEMYNLLFVRRTWKPHFQVQPNQALASLASRGCKMQGHKFIPIVDHRNGTHQILVCHRQCWVNLSNKSKSNKSNMGLEKTP